MNASPSPSGLKPAFQSIFSYGNARQRAQNFEDYWKYTQAHDGEILESEKNLTKKKAILSAFQEKPVRSRKPLPDPELFYRHYVDLFDDTKKLDRKTLLLTCIYKFARHEWAGILEAWDVLPNMERSKLLSERISRYPRRGYTC